MDTETKGFDITPYRNGKSQYIDLGDYSICSDCGKDHQIKILSQIEYTVCEKELYCNDCGHSAYFAYGQVSLGIKDGKGDINTFQVSSPDNKKIKLIKNNYL